MRTADDAGRSESGLGQSGKGSKLFGVYVGRVLDVADPEDLGRVRVITPLAGLESWARIATLFMGGGDGSCCIPAVDDEVVIAFEAGDPERPIVVGSLCKPGGQSITVRTGPGSIQIADSNGNTVTFEPSGVTVSSAAKVTVQASQVAISAGMVTVNAGMSKFSGVVQADAVITNSVVSASYTPGAGNVL